MLEDSCEGDEVLENREEDLKFYTDEVSIDQLRGGINSGGRMTRKRTKHDLRTIGRARQSDWWARVFDELAFMYMSGSRGTNADFVFPTTYTGFAGNAFSAPDSEHIIYAGKKVKATITSSDKQTVTLIDRLVAKVGTMGGGAAGSVAGTDGNTQTPMVNPIVIENERHFVYLMHDFQEYDLRTSTTSGQWLDIQKAAAGAVGKSSLIFKGGMGMYNNVVLHKHRNVIGFTDYGSTVNLPARRALFLGTQALVMAFGMKGSGIRFGWHEEYRDNGNVLVISSNTMLGMKKCTYNGKDFGVIACDTYALDPNA